MEKNSFYRKTGKKNLQTKKRTSTTRNYDSATEMKSFFKQDYVVSLAENVFSPLEKIVFETKFCVSNS